MITIQLANGSIKLYNDINQLPADRYKEFQKYQLMDSGIGADMESVDERFSSLFKHIARGKIEDARKEAENLYFAHYFIIKAINMQHLSFGCLLHSVNDEPVEDISEENLRFVIDKASKIGLTQEILEENLISSKKN